MVRLIFLCFLLRVSRAFFFNNNEIRDLESTTLLGLQVEAIAWLSTPLNTASKVSACATTYLVGGYDVLGGTHGYFFRSYTNLAPHNTIYFSITFWVIDSWDAPNDHITIDFGTEQVNSPNIGMTSYHELCGQANSMFSTGYDDFGMLNMTGSVSHSGSTLLLKIISNLDGQSNDESFGFRDINLLFVQLPSTIPKTYCTRSEVPAQPGFPTCACSEGYYPPCGVSNKCPIGCRSCYGPSPSQCYQCKSPYVWDGSQCIICHPNCNGCTGAGLDHCISCQSTKYAYLTNTCLDSCLPPLTQTSASPLTCSPACPVGQYVYEGDMNCHNCGTLNCLTCDSSKSICTSCAPGYFLSSSTYPSCSSCSPKCPSCTDKNTCQTCSPNYTLSSGSCHLISSTVEPAVTKVHKASFILSFCVPIMRILFSSPGQGTRTAAALVMPLISIITYIEFLDLSYSAKIKAFFEEPNPLEIPIPESLVLLLEPQTETQIKPDTETETLTSGPEEIEYSSFWLNSWEYLLFFGLWGTLLILAQGLCYFMKKSRDNLKRKILKYLKEGLVAQFLGGFTDVTFFLVHRAHTLFGADSDNDDVPATLLRLDFSTGIVFQLLLLIALLFFLKARKPLMQTLALDLFYQEEEHKGRDFQLLFMLRNSLICFIVHPDLWLFGYPIIQTSILLLLSLLFLIYLFIRRPLKVSEAEAECLMIELILVLVNLAVLALAIMDSMLKAGTLVMDPSVSRAHDICEDIIIYCNLAVGIVCLAFFCFSQLSELVNKFRKRRQQPPRIRRSTLTDLDQVTEKEAVMYSIRTPRVPERDLDLQESFLKSLILNLVY